MKPNTLLFESKWIQKFSIHKLSLTGEFLLLLLASGVLALSAQIKIPLPFTPVPLTLQSFTVILLASLLGSTRGTLAVALYLAQGLIGLPFFAGGNSGWVYALGATGGYLFGFLPAAWLVGKLSERGWDRKKSLAFTLYLTAHLIVFFFGIAWLTKFHPIEQALLLGWLPFVPGEILKSALVATLLPGLWKFVK